MNGAFEPKSGHKGSARTVGGISRRQQHTVVRVCSACAYATDSVCVRACLWSAGVVDFCCVRRRRRSGRDRK